MANFHLIIDIDATDIRDAEQRAAAILEPTGRTWGTALYYRDTLDGKWKLWAEPAMTWRELRARYAEPEE